MQDDDAREPTADHPELVIVVAVSRNGVIGRDGRLPWHVREDLRHFRRVTEGHALVMGRRTHESIGRALPKRRNVVLTSRPEELAEGCEAARSLDEALALARAADPAPRVIGGAGVYAEALPRATRILLTEIQQDVEGDTFFPGLDASAWREVGRIEGDEAVFRTLERVR